MQFEITNLAHSLGITVVYVTHDQTEALTMSDRVAVFATVAFNSWPAPTIFMKNPKIALRWFMGEIPLKAKSKN